jgi:hypothetical protein
MYETSGVLRPAIEAYLKGGEMTGGQIVAMRAYLRQWIAGDWAPSPRLNDLRAGIDALTSRVAIRLWLAAALREEIDPL